MGNRGSRKRLHGVRFFDWAFLLAIGSEGYDFYETEELRFIFFFL